MSIETLFSNNDTTLIIVMDEKFDYSQVQLFRDAYHELPASVRHISVDLSKTEYINSSAPGMLLNMQKSLGEKDLHFSKRVAGRIYGVL